MQGHTFSDAEKPKVPVIWLCYPRNNSFVEVKIIHGLTNNNLFNRNIALVLVVKRNSDPDSLHGVILVNSNKLDYGLRFIRIHVQDLQLFVELEFHYFIFKSKVWLALGAKPHIPLKNS